jgi:hypothetical protein
VTNVAISALPAASSLTGTELVPIVQSGVTSKTTTGDISFGAVCPDDLTSGPVYNTWLAG